MQKKPQAAKQYRYLLCMFFASDQLVIHEYNRIVDMEGEMTPTMFLAKLSTLCDVEALKKADKPRKKHEMTLYLNREWYRLRWKKKVLKVYSKELVVVDADILNKEVLNNILAIKDVRNDARLSYVDGLSGVAGITEKTEKSAYRIGFCLYPLSYKDITKVADAGKTLPPKSTWFEPRVKNGVISQLI